MSVRIAKSVGKEPGLGLFAAGMVTVFAGFVAGCSAPQPEPRSYFVFMEDALAREGVLARCNLDRDSTLRDVECSNARKAAAAIAIEQERDRSASRARESERKLLALRVRAARATKAQQSADAAALTAAESVYEQRFRDPQATAEAAATNATANSQVTVFGAPVGPVLPSMSETSLFDVYAESSRQPLNPPEFEVAAVEPPVSEVPIARPELALELEEFATIPRPFRMGQAQAIPQ